jgi:hypothetical protein
VDELAGAGKHDVRVRFHTADGDFAVLRHAQAVEVQLEVGVLRLSFGGLAGAHLDVHRGERQDARVSGWQSRYYADCSPRPTIEVAATANLPVTMETVIAITGRSAR